MYSLFIIGRILLGGYFVYSAFNHFSNISAMTGYAASKKIPAPKAAVIISGVALLLGGLSILLNKYAFFGLWVLVAFLIVATFTMHQFWTDRDHASRMNDQIQFGKNIALIGALLLLLA